MNTQAMTPGFQARDQDTGESPLESRILIVDDESAVREICRRALSGSGRTVLEAATISQALNILENGPMDVVLTDIHMQGGADGLELLRTVKQRWPGTDVLIFSGDPGTEASLEAFRRGAWDLLLKPVEISLLRDSVERCLKRRSDLASLPADLGARRQIHALHDELKRAGAERSITLRYLPHEILERASAASCGTVEPEEVVVTSLFADIRGFTQFTTQADPKIVVSTLNELLELLVDAVTRHGGFVDKFTGDGLMASFGAPVKVTEGPLRAVASAVLMQRLVSGWNAVRRSAGLVELRVGIGIATGTAVAGNVGSQSRTSYTVIGPSVNLAARLEKMAAGGEILLSPETAAEASLDVPVRWLADKEIKGFQKSVSVYGVDMKKPMPALAELDGFQGPVDAPPQPH